LVSNSTAHAARRVSRKNNDRFISPPPTQEGFDVDPEWLFNVKEENAPPHFLKLKRWCVYRILRNVSLKLGMGTRVKFQLTGVTQSGCGLTGRRISRDGTNGGQQY
jgi:hypothetical protein